MTDIAPAGLRAPVEKTIGAWTYQVKPLATCDALALLPRIGAAALLGKRKGIQGGEDFLETCRRFAVLTKVRGPEGQFVPLAIEGKDGTPVSMVTFDLHFGTDLGRLYEWHGFASEVSFGPLGAWLEAQVAEAEKARAASAMP